MVDEVFSVLCFGRSSDRCFAGRVDLVGFGQFKNLGRNQMKLHRIQKAQEHSSLDLELKKPDYAQTVSLCSDQPACLTLIFQVSSDQAQTNILGQSFLLLHRTTRTHPSYSSHIFLVVRLFA